MTSTYVRMGQVRLREFFTSALSNADRVEGKSKYFVDVICLWSLRAKRGVTESPNALPRTMASVIPPLATADSLSGNHSRVTCKWRR